MPSFRSAVRAGMYRVRRQGQGSVEDISSRERGDLISTDEKRKNADMVRRKGGSLPVQSTVVSVKVLPSRHSYVEPDFRKIPQDVIETDYLLPGNPVPGSTIGGDLKDKREVERDDLELHSKSCQDLRRALIEGIDQRIVAGTRSNGNYRLLLNTELLEKVSLDILRMSEREPSGLNGCRLRTRLERQESADMDLGCVRLNTEAEETFEIILSLKESNKESPVKKNRPLGHVRSLLPMIFACHRPAFQPVEVRVGDAYQLEKVRFPASVHGQCRVVTCC